MTTLLRRTCLALVVTCALSGLGADAWAFKVTTHVASANRVLDQLRSVITDQPGTDTLVFEVDGRRLEVPIGSKEAYQIILRNAEVFRAGVVGPDAFPDVVTGQYWQHSNENEQAASGVAAATGDRVRPPFHRTNNAAGTLDPVESRLGSSEMRAIDFAMLMLDFTRSYPFRPGEREQALAFILGYIAHGVGDSFAHTWVNQYAGGSWGLGEGRGIFGTLTEEIKHVAVETLLDHQVPGELQNHDGAKGNAVRLTGMDRSFAGKVAHFNLHGARVTPGYSAVG